MTTARDLLYEGNRWTDIRVRQALPVLIRLARSGHTITYRDLEREIAARENAAPARMLVAYRSVLEKTGRLMLLVGEELGESVPPINILVVNANSGLPGEGFDTFLQRYAGSQRWERLTENNRDAVMQRATETVFTYSHWDAIADYFGISVETDLPEHGPISLPAPPPILGGESEAHKTLKQYIAMHPELFGDFGQFEKGSTESTLNSGDKIDVLFRNPDQTLAVEAKTVYAAPGELTRGIYQCVKYRAVLRATHDVAGELFKVVAVLVTPQLVSDAHRAAAARLNVPILRVEGPK